MDTICWQQIFTVRKLANNQEKKTKSLWEHPAWRISERRKVAFTCDLPVPLNYSGVINDTSLGLFQRGTTKFCRMPITDFLISKINILKTLNKFVVLQTHIHDHMKILEENIVRIWSQMRVQQYNFWEKKFAKLYTSLLSP